MTEQQRILVVDDDEDILSVCAMALKRDGYHIETAHGGENALKMIEAANYDIVLTDLFMPPPGGAEVLRKVKAVSPSTDVIMMTGSPSLETAVAAVKDGVSDYLIKPFKKEYLLSVIRRCAALRIARLELAGERRLREELEAAYGELKRMEALQEGFIARVSHELRTPLTQVLGALEQLERGGEAAEQTGRLKTAREGGERLRALVEDIVRFSDVQGPGMELKRAPVALGPLLQEVSEVHAREAAAKKVAVVLELPAGLPVVPGDAELLRRAFGHLFVNAVRFNKPGGRVTVVATAEVNAVSVSLRDTGEGVPQGELKTMFDAFYQIANYMSRRVGGLGLGLAIVKRIVESHGGTISVESVEHEGSVFTVRLPI